MSVKRPQSGAKSELSDLKKEIRAVARHIRKYSRDKTKVAVQSTETNEEVLVDPLPGFEHKFRELTSKYEQINDGAKFRPSDEDRAYDFCEALFAEIGRRDRDIRWLTSYYHPEASMTYIEGVIQNRYDTRDKILQSYMMRYDGLKAEHQILGVAVDLNPPKGILCSATVTTSVKIEADDARTVKQMYEWVRATELNSPFDIIIKREFFWVTDARPLYHWPEKLLDYEERALREAEEEKKRQEYETLQVRLRLMEEAKKKAAELKAAQQAKGEEDEEEEYEDEEEYEEGEAEEGNDGENNQATAAAANDNDDGS